MEKIKITELECNGNKILLMRYIGEDDPVRYLDNAVALYVQEEEYVEFVDVEMDNPWIRIVIKGKTSKTLGINNHDINITNVI